MKNSKMKAVLFSMAIGLLATVSANAQNVSYLSNCHEANIASAPDDPSGTQDPQLSHSDSKVEQAPKFELYPNPGNGIMRVNNVSGPVTVRVYDLSGAQHLHEKVNLNANQVLKIDLGNLKDGMYIVKLNEQSLRYLKD